MRLGALFEDGLGVQRDCGQAKAWYLKAADQGNADAQLMAHALGKRGVQGIRPGERGPAPIRNRTPMRQRLRRTGRPATARRIAARSADTKTGMSGTWVRQGLRLAGCGATGFAAPSACGKHWTLPAQNEVRALSTSRPRPGPATTQADAPGLPMSTQSLAGVGGGPWSGRKGRRQDGNAPALHPESGCPSRSPRPKGFDGRRQGFRGREVELERRCGRA